MIVADVSGVCYERLRLDTLGPGPNEAGTSNGVGDVVGYYGDIPRDPTSANYRWFVVSGHRGRDPLRRTASQAASVTLLAGADRYMPASIAGALRRAEAMSAPVSEPTAM